MEQVVALNEKAIAVTQLEDTVIAELVKQLKKYHANASRLEEATTTALFKSEELKQQIKAAALSEDFDKVSELNYARMAHDTKTKTSRERGTEAMWSAEAYRYALLHYLSTGQELVAYEAYAVYVEGEELDAVLARRRKLDEAAQKDLEQLATKNTNDAAEKKAA